jgi:hypothetical protein
MYPNPPVHENGFVFSLTPKCGPSARAPAPCPPYYMWARPQQVLQSSVWSNPDNAYVSAYAKFRPRDLVVIRGKMPATCQGSHPCVWPNNRKYQMRYFSICNYPQVYPYPLVSKSACANDTRIVTDKAGYYTIVLSTKANRPPNATAANGVTWMQGTANVQTILVLRNMVTSSNFKHAPKLIPKDGAWTTAFGVLGPYYPVINQQCSAARFTKLGPAGCFAGYPRG